MPSSATKPSSSAGDIILKSLGAAQVRLVGSLVYLMKSPDTQTPDLSTGPLCGIARFEFSNEKLRKHTGFSSDLSYATASRSTVDRVNTKDTKPVAGSQATSGGFNEHRVGPGELERH